MRVKSEVFVTNVLVKMQHIWEETVQVSVCRAVVQQRCFHLAEILSFHNAQILNMNIRCVSVAGFQNIHETFCPKDIMCDFSKVTHLLVICLLKLELKFAAAYFLVSAKVSINV